MPRHFIFAILSSLAASVTPSCIFTHQWDISVTNNILNEDIIAHIKSWDDDLGNHTIPFKGNYNWSFCERADGHTLIPFSMDIFGGVRNLKAWLYLIRTLDMIAMTRKRVLNVVIGRYGPKDFMFLNMIAHLIVVIGCW